MFTLEMLSFELVFENSQKLHNFVHFNIHQSSDKLTRLGPNVAATYSASPKEE